MTEKLLGCCCVVEKVQLYLVALLIKIRANLKPLIETQLPNVISTCTLLRYLEGRWLMGLPQGD